MHLFFLVLAKQHFKVFASGLCCPQVLERDGWTGLEEVTRMLNGQDFAVTGLNKAYVCIKLFVSRVT